LPHIYQLIPDVKQFLLTHEELEIPITVRYGERRDPPSLRLSKMGEICPRHLWYSIHHPELAEPLPAEAIFKFSFGHTIEAQAIALAKAAGHEVTGEQDELVVDGIKGHRDCVLDGCIVDVKSCSSRMFEKFEKKSIAYDDPFGYLAQLDGYMVGSADDPLVRTKDRGYIWAIDKTLGKMVLYEHRIRESFIRTRISDHKRVTSLQEPPRCTCETVPDGKSGNIKLDVRASYSPYKHICYPHLRTFHYADGPHFLTHVARLPDVPELTRSHTRH
jgi:hypothetical protein